MSSQLALPHAPLHNRPATHLDDQDLHVLLQGFLINHKIRWLAHKKPCVGVVSGRKVEASARAQEENRDALIGCVTAGTAACWFALLDMYLGEYTDIDDSDCSLRFSIMIRCDIEGSYSRAAFGLRPQKGDFEIHQTTEQRRIEQGQSKPAGIMQECIDTVDLLPNECLLKAKYGLIRGRHGRFAVTKSLTRPSNHPPHAKPRSQAGSISAILELHPLPRLRSCPLQSEQKRHGSRFLLSHSRPISPASLALSSS